MIEKTPFTHVVQIGVVVRDIDKAVEYYKSLGIGPFSSPGITITGREVYGKPSNDVKNIQMCTQMGPVEFELVQPISGKSIQREFLENKGEGINHLGFFVDNFESTSARLRERGLVPISVVKTKDGRGNSAVLKTDQIGGVLFEIMTRR